MELQQQKLRNLQQTARRMELNQAYPDAISVWQEISLSASEAQSAEREIERLQEQQRQHGSIQDIQQQLMLRMGEIKPIYFSVAKRLKQIQKEGIVDDDSEILVNMVRQFLLQNLSSQDLTEMWQEAIGAPSVKKEVIEYIALVERLQRGEIIPVLGSEIHYHSGLLPLSAREMVRQLAQEAKYADFSGPISMISQYYEMTEYGRNTLLQSVQDAIKPVLDGSHSLPLYELFAAIAQPIMIVSSCYDRLLEQHFRARNKTFAVVSHARINDNLNKVLIAWTPWKNCSRRKPCRRRNCLKKAIRSYTKSAAASASRPLNRETPTTLL